MKNLKITDNVIQLLQDIGSLKLKVSTKDERNWFDIIYEISTYMSFETSEGHFILIHNEHNELGEIVGIYFGEKGEVFSNDKWREIKDKMMSCDTPRGYDLQKLEEIIGFREYNLFVRALQDATNQKGTREERFDKFLNG